MFHLARWSFALAFSLLVLLPAIAMAQAPGDAREETLTTRPDWVSAPATAQALEKTLHDMPPATLWQPGEPIAAVNPRARREPLIEPPAPAPRRDPLLDVQSRAPRRATRVFATPELDFAGQGFSGAFPPDTVGEIGADHYVQMINAGGGTAVTIYDKTTGALALGPFNIAGLGPPGDTCTTSAAGDPIVLYDHLAERWLFTEFVANGVGNRLCVYLSSTSDPITSTWTFYGINTPSFPDYPKYGLWPDGYYITTNEGSPPIYVLDRARMLAGLSITAQRFTAPSLGAFGFQALTPGDLDGATPPPGSSPFFLLRHRDDEAHNPPGTASDFLEIWELDADFGTPANSTLSGPSNVAVTDFDSELCGFVSFQCVPQPGTPQRLDPLRELVMWRASYRNFGTHESLLGNLTTDVDGSDHHGIRWFELRRTPPGSGAWSVHQEGTYAPDAEHRWMGSIAMDKDGNIALGYSASGSVFPSIRYTGRLDGDPAGAMTQSETTVVAGVASQTAAERWGDYSSLSIDPVDDQTFWYTNEYVASTLAGYGGLWGTRIARFRFDTTTIFTDGFESGNTTLWSGVVGEP